MRKSYFIAIVILIVVASTSLVIANKPNGDTTPNVDEFSITISPNTIYIDSSSITVTVHSNILYSAVDKVTLLLNNVEAKAYFDDNCGALVVKFDGDAVKKVISETPDMPATVELTLSGFLKDKLTPFNVPDEITVRE